MSPQNSIQWTNTMRALDLIFHSFINKLRPIYSELSPLQSLRVSTVSIEPIPHILLVFFANILFLFLFSSLEAITCDLMLDFGFGC